MSSSGREADERGAREHEDAQASEEGREHHRLRGRLERVASRLRRARQTAGPERETVLLLFKSAFAGVLAWLLASSVLGSTQPTYAPFTALLVVQSSAYRSVWQVVQYVGALLIGIFAAGVAEPFIGPDLGGFAVMLVVTLVIGRWRRLGSQGVQVSVAGVFAFNALLSGGEGTIWEIAGITLLGAALGLLVSLLILPPLRYATAQQGVEQVSDAFGALLGDVSDGLRDGLPDRDRIGDWLHRAREFDRTVSGARRAVETGAESVLYNPRRFLRRSTPVQFGGYRTLVEALARAAEQVRSIGYALLRIQDDEATRSPGADFLRCYADLLEVLARAPEALKEGAGANGSDEADRGAAAGSSGADASAGGARPAPSASEADVSSGAGVADAAGAGAGGSSARPAAGSPGDDGGRDPEATERDDGAPNDGAPEGSSAGGTSKEGEETPPASAGTGGAGEAAASGNGGAGGGSSAGGTEGDQQAAGGSTNGRVGRSGKGGAGNGAEKDGSSTDQTGEDEGARDDAGGDVLERARQLLEELVRSAPDRSAEPTAWPTYGVLLTDAERLLDEFTHAHQQGAIHPAEPV